MIGSEYHPRIPPPKLMKTTNPPKERIASAEDVNPNADGGCSEGEDVRHRHPDRPGDPCICPNPGTPKLMRGNATPITRHISSESSAHGDKPLNDNRESPDNPSIGCLSLLGWVCCLIAILWIVTVSSPFLASALTLHGWRLWTSLFLAMLPSAIVIGIATYALMKFRKIPSFMQLSETSFASNLDELQYKLTVGYLAKITDPRSYAIENGFVRKNNVSDDIPIVDSLRRLKGEIPSLCSGSDGWIYLFKDFQRKQDEQAKEIVASTWKLIAIKTAASPWKIVDIIAVIYNSTIMVAKLAKLYNRQTSRQDAFRLVCRWIINIYIAGEIGDAVQRGVEWANANDLMSSTYKPLASMLGKVAEGGANAFLVYRLGRHAMECFRPLCK